MMYLSRGIATKRKKSNSLYVEHLGESIELSKEQAQMWNRAQFGFVYIDTPMEIATVEILVEKGVAVLETDYGDIPKYYALCKCHVLINPKRKPHINRLTNQEQDLYTLIQKVELNLSVPELVFLTNKNIGPNELTDRDGLYRVQKIVYSCRAAITGEMETKMRLSRLRNQVVDSLLELLRKKYLIIM